MRVPRQRRPRCWAAGIQPARIGSLARTTGTAATARPQPSATRSPCPFSQHSPGLLACRHPRRGNLGNAKHTFLGPVVPPSITSARPPAAGGCRRNHSAAPAGPARAAGGRHGRAQDASPAAPDRRDRRRRGGERDRPWVRRRGRGGRAAARRRTRAPPRAGARRGAPSPRPGSAAAPRSGHTRARQPRTPGAGAGPRARRGHGNVARTSYILGKLHHRLRRGQPASG